MKLLIVTQVVDTDDLALGFFASWIAEFAKHTDRTEVICLKEGKHELPPDVRVHSLGKERGVSSRFAYAYRFLSLAWRLRGDYDVVFVHMNQEYILIAGWLWKLLGKRVYMWRNHYAGSWLTDIAAAYCTKVLCTSRFSYTAKYAKTVLMPVGVDTEAFKPRSARTPHSILFLARMAPSKRPDMLIEALGILHKKGMSFTASLYGSPAPADEAYYQSLQSRTRELDLESQVQFHPGPRGAENQSIYPAYEIFVNASPSGMFDKTIFEAGASGCVPLAASKDWATLAGEDLSFSSANDLADRLQELLVLSEEEKRTRVARLVRDAVEPHSLSHLAERLFSIFNQNKHG